MVIAPHTIIHLIEGCPLDDDYEHTIYWGPNQQADQIAYFTGNWKRRHTSFSRFCELYIPKS